METTSIAKKVVTSEFFPSGAVLAGVALFWGLGLFGGLSLLSDHQTLLTTLTWLLFVYVAAVLTPLAGIIAAMDLSRRLLRKRTARAARAGGTPSR